MLSDLLERLRALVFRRRQERELDDEIRFHLEREAEERIRLGEAPDQARRAAALAFGGVEQQKEAVRDARGVRPLQDLAADLRYGVRALGRNPGFTAAAVAVLGLGLGAAAAVFTVVDAVLLSPLPYPDADRLVRINHQSSGNYWWGLSVVDVQAIRDQQRSLEAFGALQIAGAAMRAPSAGAASSGGGAPERIVSGRVMAGFFQALGVRPARGRLVEVADEDLSAPPVVVVSHALAERVLGGAEAAVGRALILDGVSHAVVGVLPPRVDRLAGWPASAWSAFQMRPPERRGPFGIRGFARLRPGVSLDEAARDLAGISERIFPLWASGFQDREARYVPTPLRDTIVDRSERQLWLFGAAVVLVLLIAVANVATLMLVRAAAREPELALRTALGATRLRLARLVITESLLLTVMAGAAGLGVAALALKLTGVVSPNLPRIEEVGLDARTAGFLLVTTLAAGLLVGLASVSRVMAARAAPSLRASLGVMRRWGARDALVVAEFALALPLLVGAGLLLNSFLRLGQQDPGFDPKGVVAVGLGLPSSRYPDSAAVLRFWRQALARLEAAPEIAGAGLATNIPPDAQGNTNNFTLVARPVPPGQAEPVSPWSTVSTGFFTALGIPLLEGRLFTDADTLGVPGVVVVSRSWAQHYFPRESAVGQLLISGGCISCPRTTVVGVVGDVHYQGLRGDADAVYSPLAQDDPRGAFLVIRTRAAPAETFRRLRAEVAALDSELPVAEITVADLLADALAEPGRIAGVLGAFAAAALLLAALGVFGLQSYVVRQRRREIGIRIALGAEPAAVTRMIVLRGLRYVLLGTLIGFGGVLVQLRWLRALLFGVEPGDPATLVGAGLVLFLAALLACWLPGRRAARIHPIEALSAE